jgi:hypothetical protein
MPPLRLINLARERALKLCTSNALLTDLAEVIGRGKFVARGHDHGVAAAVLVEDHARLAYGARQPQPS